MSNMVVNRIYSRADNPSNDVKVMDDLVAENDLIVNGNIVVAGTVDGRDISVDGDMLDTHDTNISTNATNISTNATNISTNATNIATNATNTNTNTGGITTNVNDILLNTNAISNINEVKNLIAGGRFHSWQEGTTRALAGTADWFADSWLRGGTNGGAGGWNNVTISRQPFTLGQSDVPNGSQYYARVTVDVDGTSTSATRQDFVSSKIYSLSRTENGDVAVSFYAKASVANQEISVYALQRFGMGGSPSAFIQGMFGGRFTLTNVWQKFTATIAIDSITGKTLGTDELTDFLEIRFAYEYGTTVSTDIGDSGAELLMRGVGTIDLADVQVEHGAVATKFDARSLSIDDSMIARRFKSLTARYITAPIFQTGGLSLVRSGIPISKMDGVVAGSVSLDQIDIREAASSGVGVTAGDQAQWAVTEFAVSVSEGNSYISMRLTRGSYLAGRDIMELTATFTLDSR